MNSIAGLAIQERLLIIDLNDFKESAKKHEMNRKNQSCEVAEDIIVEFSLADEKWSEIEPLLPKPIRIKTNDHQQRKKIEAMILIFRSNIKWQDLPVRYGVWKTIYNNYLNLRDIGVWNKIIQIMDKVT